MYPSKLKTTLLYPLAVALLLLAAACSGGQPGEETASKCVPGNITKCVCPDGSESRQICNNRGRFDSCECEVEREPPKGNKHAQGESVPSGGTEADNSGQQDDEKTTREIALPLEVIGPDGTTETVTVNTSRPGEVESLWLRAYSIGYPYNMANKRGYETDKASIRLNGGEWYDINSNTVTCEEPEASLRCVEGPMHTIKFKIPIENLGNLKQGANTLHFRFNYANPEGEFGSPSTGYRVLGLEFRNNRGTDLISDTAFNWDKPSSWKPPEGYRSEEDVAKGEKLWHKRDHLVDGWAGGRIKAACADCHVKSGYDLEYFGFSNKSIIQRSRFHGLSKKKGKRIASYIRSIKLKTEDGKQYAPPGRPWDPPYQPGPTAEASRSEGAARTDGKSFEKLPPAFWAAGAGSEWALKWDSQTKKYLFPDGISVDRYDVKAGPQDEGYLNVRQIPLQMQMPDWNEWLPVHHPIDVWGEEFTRHKIWKTYSDGYLRERLKQAKERDEPGRLHHGINSLFSPLQRSGRGIQAFRGREIENDKYDPGIAELSRMQWAAVKVFEILHTNHFEDDAREVYGDGAEPLQWISNSRLPFDLATHITGRGNPKGEGVMPHYFNTAWYTLQLIINPGGGNSPGINPLDWRYQYMWLGSLASAPDPDAWRYTVTYLKHLNLAERMEDEDWKHAPEGWHLRHASPALFLRSDGFASSSLKGFSSVDYRKVANVAAKFLVDGMVPEPMSKWTRRPDRSLGLQDRNTVPAPLNRSVAQKEHTVGALLRVFRDWGEAGVDYQYLKELADWSNRAYPKGNWRAKVDKYRSNPEAD